MKDLSLFSVFPFFRPTIRMDTSQLNIFEYAEIMTIAYLAARSILISLVGTVSGNNWQHTQSDYLWASSCNPPLVSELHCNN